MHVIINKPRVKGTGKSSSLKNPLKLYFDQYSTCSTHIKNYKIFHCNSKVDTSSRVVCN